MRRLARLALIFMAASAWPALAADNPPAIEAPSEYLTETKQDYENFLVIKIFDAKTIVATAPAERYPPCYFHYNAEVVDKIRGSYVVPAIGFFSEVGLEVGREYLVQFTDADARRYRRLAQLADMNWYEGCKLQMNGLYLLYNEINPMQELWDGNTFVRYVGFSDPRADDLPLSRTRTEERKFVDFSFVRSELSK